MLAASGQSTFLCGQLLRGAGWLVFSLRPHSGPTGGRPFSHPILQVETDEGSDGRTSSRLACRPRQHLARMAAALGGQRKRFLPSHRPGGEMWPPSSFPAWELSFWRGWCPQRAGCGASSLRPGQP